MDQTNTRHSITIETKSFLALFLIPLLVAIPISYYFAQKDVKSELVAISRFYANYIDSIITELHAESALIAQSEDQCDVMQEQLLYENQLRELVIVEEGVIVCSSKRGNIEVDINSVFQKWEFNSGEYLFDYGNDISQRSLAVVDAFPDKENSGIVALVNRNYLIETLRRDASTQLSRVSIKFKDLLYPPEQPFSSNGLHHVHASLLYDYDILVEARPVTVYSKLISIAIITIPTAFLLSLLIHGFTRRYRQRDSLLDDLKSGLKRNELFLLYQPLVNSQSHEVEGVEALVRWEHPKLGLVRPDIFIPLAEQQGLINQLTDVVLQRALTDLQPTHPNKPLHVGVNIPPSYLQEKHCVQTLKRYHNAMNDAGYHLCIEITERQALDESGIKVLGALASEGVIIAIDDFGTGQTSLSLLNDAPFNYLKIDKCFVDTIGVDTVNAPVLSTIIELGHKLNVTIVAEGVETEEQSELLSKHNVQLLQGYLFFKPLTLKALKELLR